MMPPMSWSRVVVAAVLASAACKTAAAPAPATAPGEPADAVREARSLVEEAYRNLRRGDAAGMTPLLATDAFLVGPGPAEVGLERSAAAVTAGDALSVTEKKGGHKLKSSRLVAEAAADGRSAWITDQIELDGQPYAVVALAAEVDEIWVLTAIEVARTIPDGKLKRMAAEGGLAPLGELPAWTPGAGQAAGNRALPSGVLEAFLEAVTTPEALVAQLGNPSPIFVGVAPRAVVRGATALEKLWMPKPKTKKPAPRWTVVDTLGGATPDGALAWVLAHATRDGEAPQPRRLFAIYQRAPGDGAAPAAWELMLLHEAALAGPAPAAR